MTADDQTVSGVIAADGTARLSIRPTNRRQWTVQQVSVKSASAGQAATAEVNRDGVFITEIVATGGTAADAPYVKLSPGQSMTVAWANGTPGALVEATFFYDDGIS
jgi:hypothetical protein